MSSEYTILDPTATTPSRLRAPDILLESVFEAKNWDVKSLQVFQHIVNPFKKDGEAFDFDRETNTLHLPVSRTFTDTAASYFDVPISGNITGPPGMLFNFPTFVLTTGTNFTRGHIEQGAMAQYCIQLSGIKVWLFWFAGTDITGPPDDIIYSTTGTFLAIPGGAYHVVVSLGNGAILGGIVNYPHQYQACVLQKLFKELYMNPATRRDLLYDAYHITGRAFTTISAATSELSAFASADVGRQCHHMPCCRNSRDEDSQVHLDKTTFDITLPTDAAYIKETEEKYNIFRRAADVAHAVFNTSLEDLNPDPHATASRAARAYINAMLKSREKIFFPPRAHQKNYFSKLERELKTMENSPDKLNQDIFSAWRPFGDAIPAIYSKRYHSKYLNNSYKGLIENLRDVQTFISDPLLVWEYLHNNSKKPALYHEFYWCLWKLPNTRKAIIMTLPVVTIVHEDNVVDGASIPG